MGNRKVPITVTVDQRAMAILDELARTHRHTRSSAIRYCAEIAAQHLGMDLGGTIDRQRATEEIGQHVS